MQTATAAATVGAALRGELVVDSKKHREELRVLQQGMGHWAGLFWWLSRAVISRGRLVGSSRAVYCRAL